MVWGFEFAREQLEAERAALCGPRYVHLADRAAIRAGRAKSSLTLGGRRAEIDRPRARSLDGHELALPSWQTWNARDPLERRALEQMIVGAEPALCVFSGAAARGDRGQRHLQERGERAPRGGNPGRSSPS